MAESLTRGAILAGGPASRFEGRPKGLEKVGGRRILDRVAGVMREALGEDPLIVANAPEASSWVEGLVVAPDLKTRCGSLGGIYSVVGRSPDPVLIVAWDMPFVTVKLLRRLAEGARDYDVYLPASNGPLGWEPLCGVYGPQCAEPIKESLSREDFRTSAFHAQVRVGTLPLDAVAACGDPERMFFNINTPADLERAEALCKTDRA